MARIACYLDCLRAVLIFSCSEFVKKMSNFITLVDTTENTRRDTRAAATVVLARKLRLFE